MAARKASRIFRFSDLASEDAARHGIFAFEVVPAYEAIRPEYYTWEERDGGEPAAEYGHILAEGVDFVHHVEVSVRNAPVLIVTCRRDEIDREFPDFVEIRPLVMSLWGEQERDHKGRVRRPRSKFTEEEDRQVEYYTEVVNAVFDMMFGQRFSDRVATCVAAGVPEHIAMRIGACKLADKDPGYAMLPSLHFGPDDAPPAPLDMDKEEDDVFRDAILTMCSMLSDFSVDDIVSACVTADIPKDVATRIVKEWKATTV